MNRIEYLDLRHQSFQFRHGHSTVDEDWERFHAHQGIEFLLVHKGQGQVMLERQLFAISQGTLLIFQPYQLHRVRMESRSSVYTRSLFVIDPTFIDSCLTGFKELRSFFHLVWKGNLHRQIVSLEETYSEVNQLFLRFQLRLSSVPEKQHKEELILFTLSFLQLLRSSFQETELAIGNRNAPRSGRHSETIMEWVDEHYREPFSLERLSSELHMSPYHISHLFTEDTGFTITEFLIARRLREACLLLSTTSLPIHIIVQEVGWSSPSHFSQLFRKMFGISPREYRLSSGLEQ